MQNKLCDLNNHLFEQLERLNDDGLKGDALREEIEKAKAITNVATVIVNNANTMLKATEMIEKYDMDPGYKNDTLKLLGGG